MTSSPEPMELQNLSLRMRTAVSWQFLSKGINTSLQMATSIVLARLLMPADFGVVAMAAMVTGLAGAFQDLGLGQALVQRQQIREEHTQSAFWGTLVMALLLYGGVFLTSPHIGAYFSEPRMVPVLRVSALSFLVSPFAVVPTSLLQRDLDFKTSCFAGLASSLSYGMVGITMALLGYGYWALVFAGLIGGVMSTTALSILTRYRPPLLPSFRGIGDLYGFGVGVTGVGLLSHLAAQIDYFVIGRRLDAGALGLYTKAFSLVMMPVSTVTRTMYPVLFPVFSALQNDMPRFRSAYGRTLTYLALVCFPFLSLLAVSAPELIPVVLGKQWSEAILPTQIMALIGVQMLIGNPAGAAIKAVGKVYLEWWMQLARIALLGPSVWFAARWGIEGVAWAVLLVYVALLPLTILFVRSCIGFGFRSTGRALQVPVLLGVSAFALAEAIRLVLLELGAAAPAVLAGTGVLAGASTVMIAWLWRPPEVAELMQMLRRPQGSPLQ